MASDSNTAERQNGICITCGKRGESCRWTDDAEGCMRTQLEEIRSAIRTALGFHQVTHIHAALRGVVGYE